MVGDFGSGGLEVNNTASDPRAPWMTPRVIVSDLSDARANTIIPGADGTDPIYTTYMYGS
jgi:hypothetical protein